MSYAVRQIKTKINIRQGDYGFQYTENDRVISFSVERIIDESKFFGFGVAQKLNLKLIDKDRELSFRTGDRIDIEMKEIKGCKSRCIKETKDYDIEKCIVCGQKAKHEVTWGIQY